MIKNTHTHKKKTKPKTKQTKNQTKSKNKLLRNNYTKKGTYNEHDSQISKHEITLDELTCR